MSKRLTGILLILVLLVCSAQTVLAYGYNWWFNEVHGDLYLAQARSPFRNSGGTDFYGNVTSNNNQPRTTGTTVHNGTDLGNGGHIYRNVYSVFDGGVVQAIAHSGGDTYVTVSYSNGAPLVKYQHITPSQGLAVGHAVGSSSVIGTLRDYTWGNHLHFAAQNSSDRVLKLFPHYRHVHEWHYGTSMDYICKDLFDGNRLYIAARYLNGGVSSGSTSLEVYYRINYGPWQGPKHMSKIQPTEHYNWTIDLKVMSGAPSGAIVDFYIAAIADITASYKWGLWPQHYSQPPRTPAEFQADGKIPKYHTRTIQ